MPLQAGEQVVGVLTLHLDQPTPWPPSDQQALNVLASQAALAIENARLNALAQQQALTDGLTELPNRRALDRRLEEELRRSSRYQHAFTLVMVDLNGFKLINDTYGHPAGDEALRVVAACLRRHLRDTDFIARYGGDEFAILLPETERETAQEMVVRLAERVAVCRLNLPDDRRVTLSVGLALYPQDAITAPALLMAADQALYRAKRGRGAV